mmetsp:Transcript_36573/g.85730  ORF Transcript_36573/g.85730 Transcript_36573/m.85730 type:complete len:235 (-) Transcript_36573:88-792(-)|eukprot:s181_g6.t1
MARSQCVRSLLEDAFGQLEPCVRTATSGEDGEDEDAQIAAVVAKLAEDSFQLEAVHRNLRDKQLDSKTLCAAGLVAHIEAEKQEGSHDLQPAGYPSEQPVQTGLGQQIGGKIKSARPAPLELIPEAAVFQGCRVGQTYDVRIEIRNMSGKALCPRVMPCTNRAFSSDPIRFDAATRRLPGTASGSIPPGLSAYLVVHFTAKSLDDQVDQLVLSTEAGNLSLPVEALKVLPPSLK